MDDEYLNGYARLCGINATGVYVSLCRHANKDQRCFPAKKLIAQELAISERSVYTALKTLEKWNIIKIEDQGRKKDGSYKNLLYTLLNKNCWAPKTPSATGAVGKDCTPPSANDDSHRRQLVPNKDTHSNHTHSKETHIAEPSPAEVKNTKFNPLGADILKEFEAVDIKNKKYYGNTTQRGACDFLIESYGFDLVLKVVHLLPKTNEKDFLPVITTPAQLVDKWVALESGLKKLKNTENRVLSTIVFSKK